MILSESGILRPTRIGLVSVTQILWVRSHLHVRDICMFIVSLRKALEFYTQSS